MLNEEIESIIGTHETNGSRLWARSDGDIHAPSGFSTIDVLSTLGDLGVRFDDHPVIRDAVDFVFGYYRTEGVFKYRPDGYIIPCITARILVALRRLGCGDERLEACYDRLLRTQQPDGGWRCNTVRLGKSAATDASNPGTTLYVLEAFSFRKNSTDELSRLTRGVDFLLQHWETRKPLGPCEFGIGTIFMKMEYPLLRYNILYYCHTLSKYDRSRSDGRFQEAVSVLSRKASESGLLIIENPHRTWRSYSFAQKDKSSPPATSKYNAIVNSIGDG